MCSLPVLLKKLQLAQTSGDAGQAASSPASSLCTLTDKQG